MLRQITHISSVQKAHIYTAFHKAEFNASSDIVQIILNAAFW